MGQFTTMSGSPMEDTTTNSTTYKPVDKIIGSTVIPRASVTERQNVAIAVEKFSSPNIVKPSVQNIPVPTTGGMFTPSPEELQAMTAQAPDSGNAVTDTVNNAVATAKSNPILMYAAIGVGAFLIYKYFIK